MTYLDQALNQFYQLLVMSQMKNFRYCQPKELILINLTFIKMNEKTKLRRRQICLKAQKLILIQHHKLKSMSKK